MDKSSVFMEVFDSFSDLCHLGMQARQNNQQWLLAFHRTRLRRSAVGFA